LVYPDQRRQRSINVHSRRGRDGAKDHHPNMAESCCALRVAYERGTRVGTCRSCSPLPRRTSDVTPEHAEHDLACPSWCTEPPPPPGAPSRPWSPDRMRRGPARAWASRRAARWFTGHVVSSSGRVGRPLSGVLHARTLSATSAHAPRYAAGARWATELSPCSPALVGSWRTSLTSPRCGDLSASTPQR
jgi:hypothetical protein